MKYRVLALAIVVMAVALVAIAVGAEEKPWFDKNCEFCKPWMTPEMTKNCAFDQVPCANGFLSVVTFPESFRPKYLAASAEMNALSGKAATGAKIQMCGSCETMGSFFMRGAKMEEIPTKTGEIMLMTSNDSTLVADMHKWVKRNIDEEKKMKAAEKK
jgi:hypothetical protein